MTTIVEGKKETIVTIGRFRVKEVSRYSLYNALWYAPNPIVEYENIRIGQSLAIKVKLLGITLGIYWDEK